MWKVGERERTERVLTSPWGCCRRGAAVSTEAVGLLSPWDCRFRRGDGAAVAVGLLSMMHNVLWLPKSLAVEGK